MGFLGSLFGGGPKIVRAPFSAYGKLPIYKDFLRHGLAAQEAQGLRQWLDRGMSRHWDENPVSKGHEITGHTFSLRFEGLARRVVGSLWGSSDQGSLRRFPFTLFISLPVGGGVGDLAALRASAQVAEQAGRLYREAKGADGPEGFYQLLRGTTFENSLAPEKEIRAEVEREAATVTVGKFAESLYGDKAPALWPALLAYLERRRAGAGDRKTPLPPLACRLPLSPLFPGKLQAEIWGAFLLPRGEKGKSPFNVILPSGVGADPAEGLSILERDLRPDDVFLFHPDPQGYDFVEDLRRSVPGAGGDTPLPAGWDRPLATILAADPARDAGE